MHQNELFARLDILNIRKVVNLTIQLLQKNKLNFYRGSSRLTLKTAIKMAEEVVFSKSDESSRKEIVNLLAKRPRQNPNNNNIFHGRLKHFLPDSAPHIKWSCQQVSKIPNQGWLTATEFSDQKDILSEKAHLLVKLLRNSRKTILYTGAGISTSAGVKQSTRGLHGRGYQGRGYKGRGYTTDAAPNFSNMALTFMLQKGLVHDWITTNYDALPQKYGCPQEKIKEFRGSWYDPSNPALGKKGKPRWDILEKVQESTDSADLILALGSSLTDNQSTPYK